MVQAETETNQTQDSEMVKSPGAEVVNANAEEISRPDLEKGLFKKIGVTVPASIFAQEFEKMVEEYSHMVNLPGFRKGKVPKEVVRSKLKDVLIEEVKKNSVEKALTEKIKAEQIKIVSTPVVEKIDYKEGQDLTAECVVEVFPTIEIPDLASLEVELKKDDKAPDFDEAKYIDRILESNKKRVSVKDREIREGDLVYFQYQTQELKSKRFSPKQNEYFYLDNEQQSEILDLKKELLGKKNHDHFSFSRMYPADYQKKKWAGQEVNHTIEIKEVFEFSKPQLNQEFLTAAGFADEASFREKIRSDYAQYIKELRHHVIEALVVDKLLEKIAFDLPVTIVRDEIIKIDSQKRSQVKITTEEEKKQYFESLKSEAERRVRLTFILDTIADKFAIAPSHEEFENEMKQVSAQNSLDIQDVRKYYADAEHKDVLMSSLKRNKVLHYAGEKIKIKEV